MTIRRAAYKSEITQFLTESNDAIIGRLAKAQDGESTHAQVGAWNCQIDILRTSLKNLTNGLLCFEFLIPRVGKRADNIVLIGNRILVIEFKVGAKRYERSAIIQTIDYALDLKYFHEGSSHATIIPILVATEAPDRFVSHTISADGVCGVVCANATNLGSTITSTLPLGRGYQIDPEVWFSSGYQPTPTIIEASQTIYRNHSVVEITRSEAGADNLGATTANIINIIDKARGSGKKVICLVTGVPGAGKTLAGLNLASELRKSDPEESEHSVFLSGNGPLVRVLQEALARDDIKQGKSRENPSNKSDALRRARAFIQNIHHFRDECLNTDAAPTERVVVFDEAQRAWNREQTSKFMKGKRGNPNFNLSEPAFLIGAMNRHSGWAVIVCLIGEGQEINTGEAGLEEWLKALRDLYSDWHVHAPPQIAQYGHLPNMNLGEFGDRIQYSKTLHLGVSLRSFRSERLSAGIGQLLKGSVDSAREQIAPVLKTYEIRITRDLMKAKKWARDRARGSERYGMLASSGARRLKSLGIFAGAIKGNECNWFLDAEQDVRSSYFLEDAATEFEVQGLELDWAIVVWDGDLIYDPAGWICRAFKGSKWQMIRQKDEQHYRLNAYRVLLSGDTNFDPLGPERNPTSSCHRDCRLHGPLP